MEPTNKAPFDSIVPTELTKANIEILRTSYREIYAKLLALPRTREMSVAITNLETSAMWAIKSLTHNQEVE